MMAKGFSRNLAGTFAQQVSEYGSYVALYQWFCLVKVFQTDLFEVWSAALRVVAAACDAVAGAATQLAQSIRRSLYYPVSGGANE